MSHVFLISLFNDQHVYMFRMLIHPSSRACYLFVELFHGLYCSGTMCVGVAVWFGWGGVVSGCRLKHYIHPQELVTYLLSYFMGCIALVRCVLVLRCGLAGVVWYPDAG